MRRRIVTRYVAVDAGLEVVEVVDSSKLFEENELVLVKWDRRAQRRTRKAKGWRRLGYGGRIVFTSASRPPAIQSNRVAFQFPANAADEIAAYMRDAAGPSSMGLDPEMFGDGRLSAVAHRLSRHEREVSR